MLEVEWKYGVWFPSLVLDRMERNSAFSLVGQGDGNFNLCRFKEEIEDELIFKLGK
jgi:hypothetical protein